MNSLGKGIQSSQRTANPSIIIKGDSDYYRNKNIINSVFVPPKLKPLQVSNAVINVDRSRWSGTNPERDYQDYMRAKRATQIADYRRQDFLRVEPTLPNLYNNSEVNKGVIKFN